MFLPCAGHLYHSLPLGVNVSIILAQTLIANSLTPIIANYNNIALLYNEVFNIYSENACNVIIL